MLDKERGLYVAHSPNGPISLNGNMLCRHGLIAGATGTGKTVTLQVLAETFCQAGVPCFMADMKGDLSGISQPGRLSGFIEKRLPEFGIADPQFQACPVRFFDVFGEQGHPMRSTISRMGPQMLGRLMDLNETQTGVLNIVFRIADDNGLLLIDLKDLRAMLNFVGQNAAEFTTKYGNVTQASVGAIQRALLELENQGADKFFGEPDFDIYDLLQCEGGKGIMNVLAADKLMLQPKLYSTFLLWLLSELYATLPEVGEMDLPKLVFFFDEAHMLFEGTSKALTDKIEQVIRLIRSKGVGIWFITQSPTDIPANILGQLGNRVQHALRAYSPQDQKAVKVAADTFRANPAFKTYDTLLELGTGEALVSFLDVKGTPAMVERAKILFPLSQIGAVTEEQRSDLIKRSRLYGRYDHYRRHPGGGAAEGGNRGCRRGRKAGCPGGQGTGPPGQGEGEGGEGTCQEGQEQHCFQGFEERPHGRYRRGCCRRGRCHHRQEVLLQDFHHQEGRDQGYPQRHQYPYQGAYPQHPGELD